MRPLDLSESFSENEAGSGVTESTPYRTQKRSRSLKTASCFVNTEECASCSACYQPDVCPVGAIYSAENVPATEPRRITTPRIQTRVTTTFLHPAQPGRLLPTRTRAASVRAACRHRLTITEAGVRLSRSSERVTEGGFERNPGRSFLGAPSLLGSCRVARRDRAASSYRRRARARRSRLAMTSRARVRPVEGGRPWGDP